MPVGLHDLQFYNHNLVRNFPLATNATGLDVSGSFQLPTSLLVGLHIPIAWQNGINPASFYLSKLEYFPASAQLTFSCLLGGSPTVVGRSVFAFQEHVTNVSYDVVGVAAFRDTLGYVVIGELSDLLKQPAGVYTFSADAGRLELDTIRPNIQGLAGIQVESGGATTSLMRGVVRLAAGRNHRIDVLQGDSAAPVIVLNAIAREGLTEDCICADESAQPIRTINGVGPDDQGNINLLGDRCVEVEPQQFGLQLSNPCSQPCCGPEALEQVTAQLELFGSKGTTLENFLVRLEAEVSQMNLTVLGSRLGDRGCVTE